ncbi:alpha-amylase family glycosyl hydrolase [Wenyingzhuangia aestuarii]|uniref:alpha-amylase family glycosyl hydrolase n=1 Tax=Wenyingzhuangia aestuarii TaxID=1647582 RepID=UPI00143C3E9C|nr:glycosidase [Wenyingzhuangia aestuarii]NJB83725.1 sucrose phosphorylase [Wenyingzhuangia aestuarii]
MKNMKNHMNGVMLNAYPDSIGNNLHDMITVLKKPEFKDLFSLFYVLPTFFNSDLDRGFSIIDYNINKDLVSEKDLDDLEKLNIKLKFDIVLNHLSVASPQFKDLLKNGHNSKYKDFFINWNNFWNNEGTLGADGVVVPKKEHLDKLFMRKSGLPILKVRFPDGSEQAYWNTFYQKITYQKIKPEELTDIPYVSLTTAKEIANKINVAIEENEDLFELDFREYSIYKKEALQVVVLNSCYLGQMDVNANSPLVWEFYEETLQKLSNFGCKILRLDAFAYLHKQVGESNFFNKPGTWEYLERIKQIALKNNLILLPEIHAEYGLDLHDEVAEKGYHIYDFFLPGLMIHTLEKGTNKALLNWAKEIITKGYQTVNMLGCHDGIPVLDLKGKEVNGTYNKGLLEDSEIENIMTTIMDNGGMVKNLYNAEGKKISYYQINATFYSALGENDQKMLLARAIQLFMPGTPQIWYLDIFAGSNDYEAVKRGGKDSHKEINRTNLSLATVEHKLEKEIVANQLELIRLRNTHTAFLGKITFKDTLENELNVIWKHKDETAELKANLNSLQFNITYTEQGKKKSINF